MSRSMELLKSLGMADAIEAEVTKILSTIDNDSVRDFIKEQLDEMLVELANGMDEIYTDEEREGIIAFYASDLGKALLAKTPAMLSLTTKVSEAYMSRILDMAQYGILPSNVINFN